MPPDLAAPACEQDRSACQCAAGRTPYARLRVRPVAAAPLACASIDRGSGRNPRRYSDRVDQRSEGEAAQGFGVGLWKAEQLLDERGEEPCLVGRETPAGGFAQIRPNLAGVQSSAMRETPDRQADDGLPAKADPEPSTTSDLGWWPAGTASRSRGLSKSFGDVRAVDALSFSAGPGDVTAFLGPNGAGKITTLRMLLGLVDPSGGTAAIGGRTYAALDRPADVVGAALEASSFHPGRSGRDHLRVYCAVNGYPTVAPTRRWRWSA